MSSVANKPRSFVGLAVVGLAVLGLVATLPAAGQAPFRFERVEHPAGPSHNSIFAIAQDHQGFLWIGTQDGLNRYDGHEFVVYRHDRRDPGSISANRVDAVLEDSERRLWVGTATGIDRYDRGEGRFHHYPLRDPDGRQVAALELVEDRTGRLWAGTAFGLASYSNEGDRWQWSLPGETPVPVYRIREAPGEGLWLLVGPGQRERNRVWRVVRGEVTQRYEPTGDLGTGLASTAVATSGSTPAARRSSTARRAGSPPTAGPERSWWTRTTGCGRVATAWSC